MNTIAYRNQSIGEVLESDRSSVDGDLLTVCVSQAAHALRVVGQIEFGAVDPVFVIQPGLGVGEALLARAIDGVKIITIIIITTTIMHKSYCSYIKTIS